MAKPILLVKVNTDTLPPQEYIQHLKEAFATEDYHVVIIKGTPTASNFVDVEIVTEATQIAKYGGKVSVSPFPREETTTRQLNPE